MTQQWVSHPPSSWGNPNPKGLLKKGTSLSDLGKGGTQTYCPDVRLRQREDRVKQQRSQTQGRGVRCMWEREGDCESPEAQVINSTLSPVLSRNSSSQDWNGVLDHGLALLQSTDRASQAELTWVVKVES